MAGEISLEKYKEAYRKVVKEEAKRGFIVHLVFYILVNLMLIIINLLYSPQAIWFFYPLIGWGMGISTHYLAIHWIDRKMEEREAKAEYMARK